MCIPQRKPSVKNLHPPLFDNFKHWVWSGGTQRRAMPTYQSEQKKILTISVPRVSNHNLLRLQSHACVPVSQRHVDKHVFFDRTNKIHHIKKKKTINNGFTLVSASQHLVPLKLPCFAYICIKYIIITHLCQIEVSSDRHILTLSRESNRNSCLWFRIIEAAFATLVIRFIVALVQYWYSFNYSIDGCYTFIL